MHGPSCVGLANSVPKRYPHVTTEYSYMYPRCQGKAGAHRWPTALEILSLTRRSLPKPKFLLLLLVPIISTATRYYFSTHTRFLRVISSGASVDGYKHELPGRNWSIAQANPFVLSLLVGCSHLTLTTSSERRV